MTEAEMRIKELEVALQATTDELKRLKTNLISLGGGVAVDWETQASISKYKELQNLYAASREAYSKAENELNKINFSSYDLYLANREKIDKILQLIKDCGDDYGFHD